MGKKNDLYICPKWMTCDYIDEDCGHDKPHEKKFGCDSSFCEDNNGKPIKNCICKIATEAEIVLSRMTSNETKD